ncbi:MAG: diaminopimelate decarboxylase, partial [Rhizomicrobium sp.]
MNHFTYINGVLHAEDVALTDIINTVGTPFYCYSSATLERHARIFAQSLPKDALIAFSVKANGNLAVLKTLAAAGVGADVVSGGELKRAL